MFLLIYFYNYFSLKFQIVKINSPWINGIQQTFGIKLQKIKKVCMFKLHVSVYFCVFIVMSWFIEMEVDKTQEEESPKKLSDLDVSVYIMNTRKWLVQWTTVI
jgi:hypothetical protein